MIVVLAMNDPDVIRVRRSLIEEGLFPPVGRSCLRGDLLKIQGL
jgi:hypothetical protein